MRLAELISVIEALESRSVRYLVVGGVAVSAHGYVRATQDLDLVIHLSDENLRPAIDALASLGYRPMVPVRLEEFLDPTKRRSWREERNMEVFSLVSDRLPRVPVDVFVEEPFDFGEAEREEVRAELAPEVVVRIAGIPTLIRMKEAVGRPRDMDDVHHLREILRERGEDTDV